MLSASTKPVRGKRKFAILEALATQEREVSFMDLMPIFTVILETICSRRAQFVSTCSRFDLKVIVFSHENLLGCHVFVNASAVKGKVQACSESFKYYVERQIKTYRELVVICF